MRGVKLGIAKYHTCAQKLAAAEPAPTTKPFTQPKQNIINLQGIIEHNFVDNTYEKEQ